MNSTFAELKSAISRLGLEDVWESKLNPLTLRCKATGNMVMFRGCSDSRAIERLKSVTVPTGKICWCWCEEATELKASDFEAIDDRLRGQLPEGHFYQITLTFNPINSGHWIKSKLWDYSSPDIFKHHSTYLQNKFVDEAYKRRMERRKDTDPEGYRIYALGEWGEVGGLIFTNVAFGDYSKTEFDQYTMGSDFGYNHNHATLLIGWKDGSPYILQEVVAQEKTTAEIIELCDIAKLPKDVLMACDSAEPDRIREFRKAGYRAYPVKKEKNSVNNQITWLKNRKIFVDGRCGHTIKEIQGYKWRKSPTTGEFLEEPITVNDDCMAALRYGCEPIRKSTRLRTMSKDILGI